MRRAVPTLTALFLAGLLTACGSDGGDETESGSDTSSSSESSGSGDDPTEEPADEAADMADATLPSEPFCDQVDPSLASTASGLPAAKVKLNDEFSRVVGEKYVPYPGSPKTTSPSNSCQFGEGVGFFVVVQPEKVEGMVQGTRATNDDTKGCTTSDAPEYGEHGFVAVCNGMGYNPRSSVAIMSEVGEGRFLCATYIDGKKAASVDTSTREACSEVLTGLVS